MKGIVLAGGTGTRLFPLTIVTSKQLLPIYDKPLIYYPLTTLMMAGIREILIITTPQERTTFEKLLGDGARFGIDLQYAEQAKPQGIAQAFLVGKEFIGNDTCALVLGDNIFYGGGLIEKLKRARSVAEAGKAVVFGYYVQDPERFGIIEFDDAGNAISLEEKPTHPRSNYAAVGLYFYDNRAVEFAEKITPSERGELEITDVNRLYLSDSSLQVQILGRGFAWFDAGTPASLADASGFVRSVEENQGIKIAVPEEIAYRSGWISEDELCLSAQKYGKSAYGRHLETVASHRIYGD